MNSQTFWEEHNNLVSEPVDSDGPEMENERISRLENEVASLKSDMQAQMQQILAAVNTLAMGKNQREGESSHSNYMSGGGRPNGEGSSGSYLPRLVKLEFPRYNGEDDPTSWICRADQFFSFHQTPEEDRVPLASFNLEGDAQLWFQLMKEEHTVVTWADFKEGLHNRYGPTQFQDFFGELSKLQQTSSVRDYQTQFERLLVRVGRLSTEHQIGCFTSGLKDTIRAEVQASKPSSLTAAIGLARLFEARNQATKRPLSLDIKKPANSRSTTGENRSTLPTKRLSPAEMKERRDRGLCYNCNDKFSPGHRCKRLFVIEGVWPNGEDEPEEPQDHQDVQDEEIPEISLHAIAGTQAPQTMRVHGWIVRQPIQILVDSGSTHNFLNSQVARKAGVTPSEGGCFEVAVANGEKLRSSGRCRGVGMKLQGVPILVDLYLIPLVGCDAVLGAQWLSTLGPIMWDFSKLHMRFNLGGEEVSLQGLSIAEDQLVGGEEMQRELRKQGEGALLQIFSMHASKGNSLTCTQYSDDKSQMATLLKAYTDIFKEPKSLPPHRSHDHQIPLIPGSGPISVRPYRYPHFQKNEIEKLVSEMLNSGVVRPSQSPYSSPVLLVKKQDGSWRFCVDYRSLNQITIKDKFPIPIIDELLDELSGAEFFSKLDLRSGYHQIRMHPKDIKKTAFRTHQGHYEFLVMPFGLTNAPSTFQSLMNEIFQAHLRKFILVFFDDILIYSKTWTDHIKHLQIAFSILRSHKLFVKKEKCSFGHREVKYLGHIVSASGVAVDPEKVAAMVDWPKPNTIKAMRGFLGLTGYYRKFIQDYGKIARPLTQMLKKGCFQWGPQAEEAFIKLKGVMTQAPVLALPDFEQPFIIECDASGAGIGGVLMQRGRPIAFFSQALQGKNLLLSTYEKEMLAIVLAIQKWRPYLLGRQFVIKTDQKSLKHFWEQRITTPAQEKWLAKLMGYNFVITYKKGNENKAADALSRRDEGENSGSDFWAISSPVPQWVEAIKEEYIHPTMKSLVDMCKNGGAGSSWELKGDILLYKNRIFIPADSKLIPTIIKEIHSGSHEGYHKSLHRIRKVFFWHGMRKNIREFIKNCDTCQRNKVENTKPAGLLQPLPIPTQVWSDISMDFVEGLPISRGKSTIFVVVDRLSKYAHFIPISHPYTANNLALIFFENIFKLYGMPKSIVCDRDPAFTSSFWKELFQLQGTQFNFSSSYHPQTDGQTEVVNRTLEMYLRCFTGHRPKEWARWIPWAEYCYNTSIHSATKKSPYEVLYGREPPNLLSYVPGTTKLEAVEKELQDRDQVLEELKDQLKEAQARMKQQYDTRHTAREFNVGDQVFLRLQPYRQASLSLRKNLKLSPKYYGPYEVIQRIGPVAYKLQLPDTAKIHPVFHVSLLKKQVGANVQVQTTLPTVHDEEGSLLPLPQAILEKRVRRRRTEVLVHWQGLSPAEATWEDHETLKTRYPDYTLEDKGVV